MCSLKVIIICVLKELNGLVPIVTVSEASKDNVAPRALICDKNSSHFSQTSGKAREKMLQTDLCQAKSKETSPATKENGVDGSLLERVCEMNEVEVNSKIYMCMQFIEM